MKNVITLLVFYFSISISFSGFSNNLNERKMKNITDGLVSAPSPKIKKAVLQHLEGSAARDINKMKNVLHQEFRIIINDPSKGTTILDRATMLGLYEQEKFGGEIKPIDIKSIDSQGDLNAVVKVQEKGKKAVFNWYISLTKINNDWKIINALVYLDPVN